MTGCVIDGGDGLPDVQVAGELPPGRVRAVMET